MHILYILTYTVYAQFYKLPKRQGGRYMLEVSNLNKINPDSNSYLLDNITFYIPKGHICGVIGENGAGKTTLMRALMGLYSSSGSIVIDGCDMRLNEAAAKERLGIVFADDGFFDGYIIASIWNCILIILKNSDLIKNRNIRSFPRE